MLETCPISPIHGQDGSCSAADYIIRSCNLARYPHEWFVFPFLLPKSTVFWAETGFFRTFITLITRPSSHTCESCLLKVKSDHFFSDAFYYATCAHSPFGTSALLRRLAIVPVLIMLSMLRSDNTLLSMLRRDSSMLPMERRPDPCCWVNLSVGEPLRISYEKIGLS